MLENKLNVKIVQGKKPKPQHFLTINNACPILSGKLDFRHSGQQVSWMSENALKRYGEERNFYFPVTMGHLYLAGLLVTEEPSLCFSFAKLTHY